MDLRWLLEPWPASSVCGRATLAAWLLLVSAVSVYVAPLAMPPGYSWLINAISESAAQGLQGAWVARLGMLCFGLGVLALAWARRAMWARGVYGLQIVFAVLMLAAASFSHRPWLSGASVDVREDCLHSMAATGMGFAFALAVAVRWMQRGRGQRWGKAVDALALMASITLTPIGLLVPGIAGLLQRVMFALAYLWFFYEAVIDRQCEVESH